MKETDPRKYPVPLRILWEIFDFFCGDWTVLGGVAITVAAVIFLISIGTPSSALFPGILLVAGITVSLCAAMGRRSRPMGKERSLKIEHENG